MTTPHFEAKCRTRLFKKQNVERRWRGRFGRSFGSGLVRSSWGCEKNLVSLQKIWYRSSSMVTQQNLSPREKFRHYLVEHRMRKTPERFAILDKALTLPGHFGVDALYESMDSSGYHVSRATLYSTLQLLVDCGLLTRHLFGLRKSVYEVALGSHFHLVCNVCGSIREIEEDQFSRIGSMDLEGFQPTYCSTMVYGICGQCIEKQQKQQQ